MVEAASAREDQRGVRVIGHCVEWLDRVLARCVVEPKFVGSNAIERLRWLVDLRAQLQSLTEDDWYTTPPPLAVRHVVEGRYRDALTKTICWEAPKLGASERLGIRAHSQDPLATLYGECSEWEERRERGRAVWILIHGWLGGSTAWERRAWPLAELTNRFDLVGYALPGHGLRRANPRTLVPSFPSRHPGRNAVGLAQAVAELRQLVQWLRTIGYRQIGIAGTSLGAYVAALYATVSVDCERLLLERPLVRMSEPLRAMAQRRGASYAELLAHLEAVYAPVSPLNRALRPPRERVDMLLGSRDRIAGFEAGQALARHFGVDAEHFAGGHLVPLGRSARLMRCFLITDT